MYLALLSLLTFLSHCHGQAMQEFAISKFMENVMNAKQFSVNQMHPNNDVVVAGTAVGWAYGKSYFSQSSCDDSNIAVQYGIATNLCVSSVIDGQEFSTIVTCNSNVASGVFYNGTNCDPSKKFPETLSLPLGRCLALPSQAKSISKLLVGVNRTELFCSSSSSISLPGKFDWTLNSDFFINDTTCAQQTTYSAFRNNQCYTQNGRLNSNKYSYKYSYPNQYQYYTSDCAKVPDYVYPLVTTCVARPSNPGYLQKYFSSFVSNTNNPVAAFLSFASNITLAGLTTSTLSTSAQLAIMNATATSMKLPMSDVLYTGSAGAPAASSSVSANLVKPGVTLRRVAMVQSETIGTLTTYSLVAETTTTVSLSSSQDPNTAYSQYTTALTNAVSSSAYSQSLQSASKTYGAVATSSASATGVTSSSPTVQTVSSDSSGGSSSDDGLSDGAIAGIVIGVVVGVGILVALAYYLYITVFVGKGPALAAQPQA